MPLNTIFFFDENLCKNHCFYSKKHFKIFKRSWTLYPGGLGSHHRGRMWTSLLPGKEKESFFLVAKPFNPPTPFLVAGQQKKDSFLYQVVDLSTSDLCGSCPNHLGIMSSSAWKSKNVFHYKNNDFYKDFRRKNIVCNSIWRLPLTKIEMIFNVRFDMQEKRRLICCFYEKHHFIIKKGG